MKLKYVALGIVFLFISISVFTGCKPSVPSEFISSDDMENLLYDYHLADAMAGQAKGNYDENLVAYRTAVLRKYGVSQEKFDTSMVYYMRHTDELYAIYNHIAERMQNEAKKYGSPDGAFMGSYSASGDTADVWKAQRSIVLIPNQPFNLYSYSFKTDSTFHKGDKLILNFNCNFIFQDGMRSGVATMTVILNNDSVISRTVQLSSSMPQRLEIDDNDSLGMKEVKGYFILTKDNSANGSLTTLQLMSISNIYLMRCHVSVKPGRQKPVESQIPVNGSQPDSQRMRPQGMPDNNLSTDPRSSLPEGTPVK